MKRMASVAVAVALALGTQSALALGLGTIRVKSALGQPLLAEIPIRFDTASEAKSLHVGIASPDAYRRAGISSGQMGIPLQFTVVGTADGGHVIRVTTADPVRDPYVEFLLDAESANGSLIREYTILLDPPGFAASGTTTEPMVTHAAGSASPPPAPMPAAPASAQSPVAAAIAAPPSAGAGSASYTVRAGDTAYAIAQRNLPAGVGIDQMLDALRQANPHAFIHGNINEIERGAILRIPSAAAARAIPPAEARAAVREQMQAWQAHAPQPLLNASSAAGAASPAVAGPSEGHLELVPPAHGGGAATRAGVKGGTGSEAIAGLQRELTRAQEGLASEKLHSADLKARIEQLQKINTNNGRLLTLKNNEIAQLQAKLAQVEAHAQARPPVAASSPAHATSVAVGSAAVAPAAARSVTPGAAASTAAVAPVAASSAAPHPAPVARPASRPPARAGKSGTPYYEQPLVLGGAALVVMLGLVGILLSRRKRKVAPGAAASLAGPFTGAPADPAATAAEDDDAALHAELASHPDDAGLYLELASQQYGRMDSEGFIATAEAMHAHVDEASAEWDAVRAMGRELAPQHPLFADAGEPESSGHDALEAGLEHAEAAPDLAELGMEPIAPAVHTLDEIPAQPFEDPYAPMLGDPHVQAVDPIDTKLDLARAYLDMGDHEGARSMLEEVLAEGSQVQQDEARRLLDSTH